MRRFLPSRRALAPLVLLASLAPAGARAQEPAMAEARPSATRAITGRVIGEGGKPVSNATVWVRRAGPRSSGSSVRPGLDGSFRSEDLEPGVYNLYVNAPACVMDHDSIPVVARPGDDVTLRLVRGGVITGRVTDADGEPTVSIPVRAKRLRDDRGRPLRSDILTETSTDDRGEYRLYGVPGGTYVVMAGGKSDYVYTASIYTFDAPTYHPSATLDTAVPVAVQPGQEITGVDIRYRSLSGHRVTGRIERPALAVKGGAVARLMAPDGTHIAYEGANPTGDGSWTFQLDGVPDGEYLLWGAVTDENVALAGSATQRIIVRGADVTDLSLTLVPYGAMAGTIAIEPGDLPEACAKAPPHAVAETSFNIRRETKGETDAIRAQSGYPLEVDEKGAFVQRGMRPGKYWFVATIPADLYVKAMSLGPPPPAARARAAPLEAMTLMPGKTVSGVRIVIARGAAAVRGRVVFGDRRLDGDRLFVHLVPAEADHEGATLRYYEAEAGTDGTFTLESLAPGKYWVVADVEPAAIDDRSARRAAWNPSERRRLRAAGARAKVEVTLAHCAKLTEFQVPLR